MQRLWRAFLSTRDGFLWAARNETAIQQEIAVLAISIPLSFVLTGNVWLRLALIGLVLLIIIVELLNTAIEKLADVVTRKRNPAIKVVKDLGSAAVFCSLVLAGLVWLAALIAYIG